MKKLASTALFLIATACASLGTPPGGPVDTTAPKILKIVPDSAKTGVNPREVVFQFDEVVNERPSGAPSLEALFLISPLNGDVQASWHRSEISVRPRRGFKPNTTYTVILLPGLSDLRGNVRNTGAQTVFSTGSTIATGKITGTLFNWPEARIVAKGLVEARPVTDTTTVYQTVTDSVGDFSIRNMPPATYRVRGISDDNNNRGLDPREPFDTTMVTLADSAKVELLAFVHDSVGTRLASVSVMDSVTLELNFDNPLSVTSLPTAAQIRVRSAPPDSSDVIPVTSVITPAVDSTGLRTTKPAAPAAGAPAATIPITLPSLATRRPPKPAPFRSLIIHLARPLRPRVPYRVRVTDVQNLIGVAKTSERDVSLPAPPAPPPTGNATTTAPPAKPPSPIKK